MNVLVSDATALMLGRDGSVGIGRVSDGFGSRVGGSSSSGKVAIALLLICFLFCVFFCYGWCDGEGYEFFSA